MISYIKGALGAVEDDVIVVETGGIGLAVHVPLSLLEELPALGEEVTVYTYFQVREDAMTLYGFLHRQDREMFKQLIGVNGIGPKGALGILSIMRPDDLRIAIVSGDAKAISKAPGIGAKTAQRLILDLKDKVDLEEVMMASFGRSFLPPFNEGSFTVSISTLPGISLEESDKIGRMAEDILLSVPEVQTVGRKTGRAELDEHALGVNTSEIEAPFILDKRSKDEVLTEIREKIKVIPGVNIEIGAPITHRINAMLSGSRANIAIKLFGTDLNRMYEIGNQIKNSIQGIEGVADLNVEQQVERPQLKIEPKREMLAKYGVTLPQFGDIVNVMLGGEAVSQVYEENRSFDLTLKVNDASRASAERIRKLIVDANGRKVPLENIANVTSSMGPNTISRENVARKIVISANVAGRDLRGVVNDIQSKVDSEIQLPEGYHIEYGGQFESEQAASRIITITSIFSILVIFLLLFKEFKSATQSLVILLNLPLALIGGVFSIYFTSGILSIPAIIGFISLFGIATRNGMLLIDRYNSLRASGMSVNDSILHGSMDRLNPILMTALSSGLALIPLALGGELPGNEIQRPMAKVILGGLLSSTILNGFIIPIMYLYISRKQEKKIETIELTED